MKVVIIGMLLGLILPSQPLEWQNPVIQCQPKEQEDPVRQFPQGEQAASAKDIEDFCNRMTAHFRHSGLSNTEAHKVYQVLHRVAWLKDSDYGMPDPDSPSPEPLTLQAYKKRIAIRKTGKSTYELLYSYWSCGTHYEYTRIRLTGSVIGQQERIEAWSGLFPC